MRKANYQRPNYHPTDEEITRHHLQSVIDGHTKLYNEVSKEYVKVTNDTIEGMINMFAQLSKGHGIEHLVFIHGKHYTNHLGQTKISFPLITGDSDTDELLEDERLAQLKVVKELKEKGDRKAEKYIDRLLKIDNDILDAIEDRAVDQQINMMRGK